MNSGVYPPQQDMGEGLVLLPGVLWYQDDQFFIGSVEYRVEISNESRMVLRNTKYNV